MESLKNKDLQYFSLSLISKFYQRKLENDGGISNTNFEQIKILRDFAKSLNVSDCQILEASLAKVPPLARQLILDIERDNGFKNIPLDDVIRIRDKYKLRG
jgi:hypothetical protein